MLELNQCYNMDCMKGMAQFPDGFFDLAVVDPPYFSGPERRGYYGSKVSKIGVYRDYPVSPVWEIPGRAYFDELRRVAKHYIVWGCNYFSYEFAPGRIVWDKCKKGTSFSDCDLAATDLFNTVRLFRFMHCKCGKSASRAPAGESIEQRPEEIDEREEFGHWEGDTVYSGKGKRKTTRALLTLTERKTRKEIIIAIPNRKAETVVKALDALERKLGARRFRAIFKSITFDNGTEFAAAEELERSCVNKRLPRTKVYFCHPYSSWERGTNENTNGMIRRRFPKGTNFAAVTNAQIAQAENWINNYPRKILGYKSSEIVFRECLRELGIAA